MIPEYLMQKYNYGYVHSCELLEEPFVKDLLKENQELKKQLEVGKEQYTDLVEEKEKIKESHDSLVLKHESQQKEFIEWLESMLVSELGVFTEIKICDVLSKYKETIGGKNE